MSKPDFKFKVGDYVKKMDGYSYQGEVRAAFTNRLNYKRYVVEATGHGYEGMLHIYNEDQLVPWPVQRAT